MTDGGVFDRLMRGSVDRALRMQPKKTQRVADELLYASPAAREEVAAMRVAGTRLVDGGLTAPSVGAIAIRRGDDRATVTTVDVDLRSIDNRHLESVGLADRRSPVMAGLRAGGRASIYAFPAHILALASSGAPLEPVVSDLADVVGSMTVVDDVDEIRTGLTALRGRGVISTHDDPVAAVARLEAAELLAHLTIVQQRMRREHG